MYVRSAVSDCMASHPNWSYRSTAWAITPVFDHVAEKEIWVEALNDWRSSQARSRYIYHPKWTFYSTVTTPCCSFTDWVVPFGNMKTPLGTSPKIWISAGTKQEFLGGQRRIRRRPTVVEWPNESVFLSPLLSDPLKGSHLEKDVVPVMPYISVGGEPSLMSITNEVFGSPDESIDSNIASSSSNTTSGGKDLSTTATDSSVDSTTDMTTTASFRDYNVNESSDGAVSTIDAESSDSWNLALHAGNPPKSVYRVTLTHDFSETATVLPRGLFNTNNMCFYNSVLQVLVHCGRFHSLINDIIHHSPMDAKKHPILNGITQFFYHYSSLGNTKRAMSGDEFYDVICTQPRFHVERGRQEDAQEFLSDLLDVIESDFKHSEPTKEDIEDDLLARKRAAASESQSNAADAATDDGWMEVGHNNRVVETQHAGHQDLDNPIEELFGGRFRSILVKKGGKPSITIEPFQQIPVDISAPEINTVQQAFDEVFKVEYLNLDNGQATKRLEIERLPPVLIVNLKRFTFIRHGDSFDYGKITKPVLINEKLTFTQVGNKVVNYSPSGVIYHHGLDISRGHYTADVKVDGQWFSIDDEQVVPVDNDQVVGHDTNRGSRSAYMVFYTRAA